MALEYLKSALVSYGRDLYFQLDADLNLEKSNPKTLIESGERLSLYSRIVSVKFKNYLVQLYLS